MPLHLKGVPRKSEAERLLLHIFESRTMWCRMWCWGGEWEEHSSVQILCFMNSLLPDGCDTLAHRTSAHLYFVTSAHQYYDISSSKCRNQLIKMVLGKEADVEVNQEVDKEVTKVVDKKVQVVSTRKRFST